MASAKFPLDRRTLITGLGAAALSPALPAGGLAQPRPALALTAAASPPRPAPGRSGNAGLGAHRSRSTASKRGEKFEISVGNELPAPVALHCRGIDGASAAEPLISRAPLAARSREAFQLPLRHAGTFLCDPGLLGDGQACPFRATPLIVPESEKVAVDRDEVLLIEEWRLRPDGIAIAPGVDPKDTTPLYTLNGKTSFEFSATANERLRLRVINASQRSVLAIKLEGHEVRCHGHRRRACRAVLRAQRRTGFGARRPHRCVHRRGERRLNPAPRRQAGAPDRQAQCFRRSGATRTASACSAAPLQWLAGPARPEERPARPTSSLGA